MNDDGTMARLPDLEVFAREHGLEDRHHRRRLIEQRSHNETLIERVGEPAPTAQGEFDCSIFRDRAGGLHLALAMGPGRRATRSRSACTSRFTGAGPARYRLQRALLALPRALAAIQACERGVGGAAQRRRDRRRRSPRACSRPAAAPSRAPAWTCGPTASARRSCATSACVACADGSPRRMPSMVGYGSK